ncbi:neuropilin and tolloid-like isoform X2 [Arctopsyche grandis]
MADEDAGPCQPFDIRQPDQLTFYSPGHPENYPNKTDCFTLLSAEQGQIIRLDWRNTFHIEYSEDCQFDYLEIRDGPHGYSTLLGKYCGKDFPPMLTSQGRHLWLRFHSDENIEYSGFTAVYEFIPKPTTFYNQQEMDDCIITTNKSEGIIKSDDIELERKQYTVKYGVPLDCMWIISVEKGKKVFLSFKDFNLAKPNDCDSNVVDVFSNRTDQRIKTFCGSIADNLEIPGNKFHLRYMVYPKAINSTFELLYTAYREKDKDQNCLDDEYDCEDNTCINLDLKCNGRFNCRLKWDEDNCLKSKDGAPMQSEHIVIILVVFSLILFGMAAAFVFNCVKKLISDHRIIQEHIRQSQEGNLDAAGRLPTKVAEPVSKINIKQDGLSPMSSTEQLDNVDCYVPGVGEILPILLQSNKRERINGDPTIPQNNRDNEILMRQREKSIQHDQDKESESDDQEKGPEMCDSCCQTRESLFQTPSFHHQSSSDGSFSPIPPSVDYSRKPTRNRDVHSSDSSVRPVYQQSSTPFSTFGYSGSTVPKSDSRQSSKSKDPKYKAEAVIEMERFGEDNGNYVDPNRNRNRDIYKIEDQMNRNRIHLDTSQSKVGKKGHNTMQTDKYVEHAKKQLERRPYSVETTKSAPDVIIMTKSH